MRCRNEGFENKWQRQSVRYIAENLKLNLEETAMKSLFEQMGGAYILQDNYYLPNLTLPAEENKTIGIWGIDICAISNSTVKCFTPICSQAAD